MASLRAYRRFVAVAWQFSPLLWSYLRDRRRFVLFGGRRRVTEGMREERARRLLDSLLTLGPTFIKLGQLLSTRPDVLPPAYVDVLSRLQDRVPPAPWEDARGVIEADLGPVDEQFDDFDRDPISGASLGQVYRAEYQGEPVAVKVRRPGIEDLVEADLRVIRWTLPLVVRFVGESRAFSISNLADEFAKTIREEMDYEREARMLAEIQSNFADRPKVRIPTVADERSTERVLTMEYVPGTKIDEVDELDRRGIDRTAVAERLTRSYFQMIVDDGVFHADPHPGNLAVQDDGTIVFYDFGMSGRVDEFVQDKIVDFYVAVANQDIDGILDALVEMGTLSPEADRATMAEVMELAIRDARGEDIETYRVQQIVGKVEDTLYDFPLRLPQNLALVLRVATVVEGVCVTLDPDFDFVSVATDYLAEAGYREAGVRQFVEETGEDLRRAARASTRLPPKLDRALDRVDRDDFYVRAGIEDDDDVVETLARRLVLALFAATTGLSATLVFAFRPDAFRVIGALVFLTALLAVGLYRSFRRSGLRATPQFTRQNLRQQRGGEGRDRERGGGRGRE